MLPYLKAASVGSSCLSARGASVLTGADFGFASSMPLDYMICLITVSTQICFLSNLLTRNPATPSSTLRSVPNSLNLYISITVVLGL